MKSGKTLDIEEIELEQLTVLLRAALSVKTPDMQHDKAYLDDCLANLKRKNVKLVNDKTVDNFLEKE